MWRKIFVLTIFLVLCCQGYPQEILIATPRSEFKDTLTDSLTNQLKALGLVVKVVGLSQVLKENSSSYQAIILINSCWAWRPSGIVRKFWRDANEALKNKTIIITTAARPSWRLKYAALDAITAASQVDSVPKTVERVIAKIKPVAAANTTSDCDCQD